MKITRINYLKLPIKGSLNTLLIALLIIFNTVTQLHGQSAGSSDLSSIEYKAKQISQNEDKVTSLNREHLESYALEQDKLLDLKRQLAKLLSEFEDIMDEMRSGRFCNGCNSTASQLRGRGIGDVEQHFADNGGTHQATQAELDKKENELNAVINAKREEIKQFEFGENEFTRKRDAIDKQMEDLKNNNEALRAEIVALSKSYKERVIADGKSRSKPFVEELMRLVAELHYYEDCVDIFNTKLNDLGKEEQAAIEKSKEKVRIQNEEDKSRIADQIAQIKLDIQNLTNYYSERKGDISKLIFDLNTQIFGYKTQLMKSNIDSKEKELLEAQKQNDENKLTTAQNELNAITDKFNLDETRMNAEIQKLNDDSWKLTINLSKRQDAALIMLKEAFTTKRDILTQAKVARENSLIKTGELIAAKKDAADKAMLDFSAILEDERIRLLTACGTAGCSCYGYDAKGDVWGNWTTAKGCVNEMHSKKHNDISYGCQEESASYQSHYRSMQSGMSDSDIEALKRSTSKTKYDAILNKIN
jgi:hypothetical protein